MDLQYLETIEKIRNHINSSIIRSYGNPLAGVLVPIYELNEEPYLLLTERSSKLKKHSGQISFPGGTVEPEDLSIQDTALRETEEEIGLDRSDIDIIGLFHDFRTPYYSAVTPIVGTFEYPKEFVLEPAEIEAILEVPLSDLLDPSIHHTEKREYRGNFYTLHFFNWKDLDGNNHNIWGATAGVIYELLEVIAPETTKLL